MTSSVELELPFPISVNQAFSQNKQTGRRFVSKRYKAWKMEAGWMIRAARIQPINYPVNIVATLTPPDKRHRDGDNCLKCVQDVLVECGVLADDDSRYVRSSKAEWSDQTDKARPRVTVTITPAAEQIAAGGPRSQTMELSQRD